MAAEVFALVRPTSTPTAPMGWVLTVTPPALNQSELWSPGWLGWRRNAVHWRRRRRISRFPRGFARLLVRHRRTKFIIAQRGPLALAKKADTRRRRRSRITSYVHHRRSRCSARGPTTAPFAPPQLVSPLASRMCLRPRPQAPPCEPQVAAIFAVRIPLIKSDSNVTR